MTTQEAQGATQTDAPQTEPNAQELSASVQADLDAYLGTAQPARDDAVGQDAGDAGAGSETEQPGDILDTLTAEQIEVARRAGWDDDDLRAGLTVHKDATLRTIANLDKTSRHISSEYGKLGSQKQRAQGQPAEQTTDKATDEALGVTPLADHKRRYEDLGLSDREAEREAQRDYKRERAQAERLARLEASLSGKGGEGREAAQQPADGGRWMQDFDRAGAEYLGALGKEYADIFGAKDSDPKPSQAANRQELGRHALALMAGYKALSQQTNGGISEIDMSEAFRIAGAGMTFKQAKAIARAELDAELKSRRAQSSVRGGAADIAPKRGEIELGNGQTVSAEAMSEVEKMISEYRRAG